MDKEKIDDDINVKDLSGQNFNNLSAVHKHFFFQLNKIHITFLNRHYLNDCSKPFNSSVLNSTHTEKKTNSVRKMSHKKSNRQAHIIEMHSTKTHDN